MSLRWYQREAVDACWQYLCGMAGNPIIVAPTGAGKSHILAQIARDAVERYQGRVMILAHRKELLEQNADKLGMDAGLYSAGLGQRDTEHDVICAGIQSVYSKAHDFGQRNLVIIDEAHLVPLDGEGMYRQFASDLRSANPTVRMVGLTATPFRLDCGPICRPDGLFQNVCYSVPIKRLIAEGYLCPLVTRGDVRGHVDSRDLRIRGGEYVAGQMADVFGRLVGVACQEIVSKTAGRHSVLVFCAGVGHAEQVADELESLTGEQVGLVHGETPAMLRESLLQSFRRQELRWLVNCDVLTTGFDAPCIDAIAVLRATLSPGLFAQMVGRGFRVHESKQDCLVLDFGENIQRHGPIDSPQYGIDRERTPGQREAGEAPTKKCPNCGRVCLLADRECSCGFIFAEPKDRHGATASNDAILSEPVTWQVDTVSCQVWKKKGWQEGDPRTLRISYECVPLEGSGGNLEREVIHEWVCVEHQGFAGSKATAWWQARCEQDMPADAEYAAVMFGDGLVARPRTITTVRDGRWYRIVDADLEPIPEAVQAGGDYDDDCPF